MTSIPARDLIRDRLRNQKLAGSRLATPTEVVAWLGAVQAQDYSGAKWAIGLRAAKLSDVDVDRAFDAGAILRTHVLRPTWHFVTPPDIRWILTLSAPRVHAASASMYRKFEFDTRTLSRSRRAMERALQGGKHLTREELASALARAGIAADGLRLAYLLIHAELEQIVCSGPRRGKQFTYALFDERVPAMRPLPADEALARLTERYFSSHGPATVRDYVWWSGLTVRQAKTGIEMVKPSLEHRAIDHLTYWSAPSNARAAPVTAAAATFLLPNYDEYLIAYRDRAGVVDASLGKRWGTGMDAYAHPLVIGGRFAGVWRRTLTKDRADVSVAPYRDLSTAERRALTQAAERYGRFMKLRAVLSLS